MTDNTTFPIEGNQFFNVVTNKANQQPTLTVVDLKAHNARIETKHVTDLTSNTTQLNETIFFSNGHILNYAAQLPTVTVAGGGLTTATMQPNSTDVSGSVAAIGSSVVGSQIIVTYHTAYPTSFQSIIVNGFDGGGADAVNKGIYVTTTNSGFTIHFMNIGAVANPAFHYLVIGMN